MSQLCRIQLCILKKWESSMFSTHVEERQFETTTSLNPGLTGLFLYVEDLTHKFKSTVCKGSFDPEGAEEWKQNRA